MEESSLKIEFLHQLNDLIQKDEESWKEIIQPINMKEIYIRFKTQSEQITIKDLQNEIKNLKQEIQIFKQNDITLEYRLLKLEGINFFKGTR